jgi:molecular chaperone GrpE
MGKRKKKRHPAEEEAQPVDPAAERQPAAETQPATEAQPEAEGLGEAAEAPGATGEAALVGEAPEEGGGDAVEIESAEEAVARLIGELDAERDRYLRLAAEFDNFRKRVVREKTEMWNRAQADVVSTLLEALDDLSRVAHLDPAQSSVGDVIAGVELVERKLMRELEKEGLQRTGVKGEQFDPNYQEAVATAPAPTEAEEGLIAAVLQVGYRLGNNLLRPARVQVYVEQQVSGESEA